MTSRSRWVPSAAKRLGCPRRRGSPSQDPRDDESDLNYHRARYYDPAAGRWISEDPIGFAAGDVNLARYVENNPTNLVDSSGLARGLPYRPYVGPSTEVLGRPTLTVPEDEWYRLVEVRRRSELQALYNSGQIPYQFYHQADVLLNYHGAVDVMTFPYGYEEWRSSRFVPAVWDNTPVAGAATRTLVASIVHPSVA